MKAVGLLGTVKLLIRALGVYGSHQAAVANELKVLNKHIERIYPVKAASSAPAAEEPLLGDDPYTLAMAADAESVLRSELGRDANVEEILERMKVWTARADPVAPRRNLIDSMDDRRDYPSGR